MDFRNFGQYLSLGLLRTNFRQTSEILETLHSIYYVMLRILQRVLGDILDNSLLTVYYMYVGNVSCRIWKLRKLCVCDCRHCTWLKLSWNYLPAGWCWDLGLSNIFGCCLVNSCGGL